MALKSFSTALKAISFEKSMVVAKSLLTLVSSSYSANLSLFKLFLWSLPFPLFISPSLFLFYCFYAQEDFYLSLQFFLSFSLVAFSLFFSLLLSLSFHTLTHIHSLSVYLSLSQFSLCFSLNSLSPSVFF